MILKRSRLGDATVVRVEGGVKLGESAAFFVESLETCLEEDGGDVLVDFSRLDEIDSTGLGELVGLLGRFKSHGRRLVLVQPSPRLRRLLEISRLVEVFEIHESVDRALAAGG